MARPLSQIAQDISEDWEKPNYAAAPYLEAMLDLDGMNDSYGQDSARSVVLYFLTNAGRWRGPKAKAIKAELKGMLKTGSMVQRVAARYALKSSE